MDRSCVLFPQLQFFLSHYTIIQVGRQSQYTPGVVNMKRDLACAQETSDAQHMASLALATRRAHQNWWEGCLQLLASGGLHLTVLLETDGRHVDEASGLGGREVTNLIHAGLGHVVQLLGLGGASQDGDGALVGAAADLAVDGLLRSGDGGLKELTLGGEVHAVVQKLQKS